jgi:chemotaxis protein methyltransferase CheR
MIATEASDPSDLELDLLLETIYSKYHYDFRGYARSTLRLGVSRAQFLLSSPRVTDLVDLIIRDDSAFAALLREFTIQTSDLFRDPFYYRVLRESAIPHLATYPSVRIWVAGCGMGEEAYSMAIVLHEEGLLTRSMIYATDIDVESLQVAESGVYPVRRLRAFSENYLASGGRASLSDYYTTQYSQAAFARWLRKHLLFSDHSLATDGAFGEMQLVSCRNVLIYFEQKLQDRAISLFRESLSSRGFLVLGSQETLALSPQAGAFEPFAEEARIYRVK